MSITLTHILLFFFFFQAEDGIRDYKVTGVQTCALPIWKDGEHRVDLTLPDQLVELLEREMARHDADSSARRPPVSSSPPHGARRVSDRRERIGWYFYDWANSAFPTTVVTVFLGPWLTTVTKAAADADGVVYPLRVKGHAGSFFPYGLSLSGLGPVVLLPVLGPVADYSHRKKEMLALFAYLGAGATLGLSSVGGTRYLPGGLLFVIANVSFGASVVFIQCVPARHRLARSA